MPPLLIAGAVLAASLAPPHGGPVWLAGLPPGAPARVLATPDGLLLGSDAGLYRLGSGGWTLLMTRGGVVDLARAPDGTWIASGAGLYWWPDGAGAARPLHLGAGASLSAVDVDERGGVWVATEAGLFSRAPGARDFRRVTDLPAGEVTAVRVAGETVWAAMRGVVWMRESGARFVPRLRRLEGGWWELRSAVALVDEVLLLMPRGVWRVGSDGEVAVELGLGELRDGVSAEGTLWVASERGLFPLRSDRLGAGVPTSAVSGAAFDVSLVDGRLLVAARGGVAELLFGPPAPIVALAEAPERPSLDLPVLHRAVLRQQGLQAGRMQRVDDRARKAALLPEVRLEFGFQRDRDEDRDRDETFTSGALRLLRDEASARDDRFELSLALTWDLQEHRAPDHAIAVSRERRELIELRDQVLDRVNRLYFERLRIQTRLAQGVADGERPELEVRARELAAQLDAWTGGLFSRLDGATPHESRGLP